MLIQITQLGLAAYVKMQGATLLKVEQKVFHFESDKNSAEWRTAYANSESMKHDALVCELRQHLRPA